MVSFIGFIFIYVIGGVTFLPLVALVAFIYIKGGIEPSIPHSKKKHEALVYNKDPDNVIIKKGWIRLTNQYQPKMPEVHTPNSNNNNSGIISGIQSYVSKEVGQQKKGLVFAVLKHGTLFCYESEKMEDVAMILPMQDFQVSLYPPNKPDKPEGSIYGRTAVTRLVPNSLVSTLHDDDINLTPSICTLSEEDITCNPSRILYLTCARGIDKEDWYLGLLEAQHLLVDNEEDPQYVMMDNTHFDASAMEELIRQVQSSPSHRETAWINAVFGRLFLGMYKTDRLKGFVEMKIRKKIDKTKRPTFLDEISVRKVDVGESVPFITDPKLLSLSPEGEVIVEAKVEYHGGLAIEIETDFNWSYSTRMKPIRMHLILSVRLKSMSGRMMFKLKAPPTNRYWLAFFEMPDMEWKITPVVADKQIKLAIVTNAIESRIREVMAESFVLPNMDDTSFCPSHGKGGIFGEYVKVKRRESKEPAYVKEETGDSAIKHSRDSSVSSEHSRYRENPTVPDQVEKTPAADVLKLKNRRAESANEFALTGSTGDSPAHNKSDSKKIEMSHSTPDLLLAPTTSTHSHSDDNESIKSADQQSIAESTTSASTGSKWSNTSNYIRKRMMKSGGTDGENDHHHNNNNSDAESAKTSNSTTSGSGFLSKVARLLPADTLPPSDSKEATRSDTQSSASSNSSNKRSSLIHMAENLLTKKTTQKHERPSDEHMSEEKREKYAQRLANMRKRAEEKMNSISSSSNSLVSPPPLPPLPSRSTNSQASVHKSLPVTSATSITSSKSLLDDDDDLQPSTNQNDLPAPITPTLGRAISTDSTKSLLDDDSLPSDTNKELPIPIKPTRGRAASSAVSHDSRSSSLSVTDRTAPSRRNSTPPAYTHNKQVNKSLDQAETVVSEELKSISIEESDKTNHINNTEAPITSDAKPEESEVSEEARNNGPEQISHEEQKNSRTASLPPTLPNKPRPPLPTSPRPKLPSPNANNNTSKPELPNVPRPAPPSYQDDSISKPELPPRENHDMPPPPPPVPPRHT